MPPKGCLPALTLPLRPARVPTNPLSELIKRVRHDLLREWMAQQLAAKGMRQDLINEHELRAQSADFLERFMAATATGELENI